MYLYKSWDDSLYLTEMFDGKESLLLEIRGITTVAEIYDAVGYKDAVQVYRAMHSMKSSVPVYILDSSTAILDMLTEFY